MQASHLSVHPDHPIGWILFVLLALLALSAVLGCASALGIDVVGIVRALLGAS
jgi:hypothetical protein